MAKRARAKNFDSDELDLLTQLCEKNKELLNCKLTNTRTNEEKKMLWKKIANEISSLGKYKRTPECIKNKWCNTAAKAKKQFSDMRLYQRGTGGGPPPKEMDPIMEKVVDMYKDTAAFTGLERVEAPPPPSAADVSLSLDSDPVNIDDDEETSLMQVYTADIDLFASPYLHDFRRLAATCTATASTMSSGTEGPPPQAPSLASLPPSPTQLVPRPNPHTETVTASTSNSIQVEPLPELHRPRPRPPKAKKKVTPADLQHMQYQVLLEQKRKLSLQCTYFELTNSKIRKELGLPMKDASTNT